MRKPVCKLIYLLLCALILEGCGQRQGGNIPESKTQGQISYEIGDAGVTITDCEGSAEGELLIPNKIEGLLVTSIGGWAFSDCASLTSVNIPDGVTSIEVSAFSGCSSLTSIIIPDSVTSIGQQAFDGCGSLTSITIPEGVTSIGLLAFAGCESLTSVTIPDSVTIISPGAFTLCFGLTSVTIPDSVIIIGGAAFLQCRRLTEITIPQAFHSKDEARRLGLDNLWPDGFLLPDSADK